MPSHAAITKPIAELADVASVALRLSPQPVVRLKYLVVLADLLHPCYAKMRFHRAFDSNRDRLRQTGPSDIPKYKVTAISPDFDHKLTVLLWP